MAFIKVHLDTDIGGDLDDLCALGFLLRSPDVEVVGVTTVQELGGKRAGYAGYAVALAGQSDVPVAAGADMRLGCFKLGASLPPEERYWPEPVPPAPGRLETALALLKESIELGAIVIGPFTTLSQLERRHPGILNHAALCLMGGSIHPSPPGFPRWDYRTDYNVQADPSAAKHVLESADPMLVPIEVSVQTALRRASPSTTGIWPARAADCPTGRILRRGRAHRRAIRQLVSWPSTGHHQLPTRSIGVRGSPRLGWRSDRAHPACTRARWG